MTLCVSILYVGWLSSFTIFLLFSWMSRRPSALQLQGGVDMKSKLITKDSHENSQYRKQQSHRKEIKMGSLAKKNI